MTEKHFIIATAGHVDHGKSALVIALTGTDPDRLPEEKARGITIDLGFANLRLTDKDTVYNIGIVDVPGHEDFVKNMVAGVGAIDVALFVVAGDDGWMPQTEEHLHILTYLGIERAVVALTKSDLSPNIPNAQEQIRARLSGTPFANAPIVPTSVINGTGIDALKQAFVQSLRAAKSARDIRQTTIARRPRVYLARRGNGRYRHIDGWQNFARTIRRHSARRRNCSRSQCSNSQRRNRNSTARFPDRAQSSRPARKRNRSAR